MEDWRNRSVVNRRKRFSKENLQQRWCTGKKGKTMPHPAHPDMFRRNKEVCDACIMSGF